ncbi:MULTISPECIES: TetR/AcrR family transcriptional regulator [Geothrix]|uniref:TetR/AcrR family transcriptional regulator n=1 Tax=Geothrix TaxID=44675 RepID=UPI001FACB528|nr:MULTISPECIES: TetR/AcrR family transcriptional regulator [Geothrix]
MTRSTKQHLIEAGLRMLLERGYNGLGIEALLSATEIPKGSFYHHFKDKEDFALQVVDAYMAQVHAGLDACLQDRTRPPLDRVRAFFELTQQAYREQGYMGCLLGGLGQELSGVSEAFRAKIEACFAAIAARMAACLDEALQRHELPEGCDVRQLADRLVDCWEGAALRSRLRRDPASLAAMLDFYLNAVAGGGAGAPAGL